jgi:GTP-binding protein Era
MTPTDNSTPPEQSAPEAAINPGHPPGFSFRAGFVALLGKPNAGKSTLMNALLGTKLAIVTPKAQTTRDKILGFFTTEEFQAVFVDMPGIIEASGKFNQVLMDIAADALKGVDLVLHLIDVRDKTPWAPEIEEILRLVTQPTCLVWTHCDLLKKGKQPPEVPAEWRDKYAVQLAISSTKGLGLGQLVEELGKNLPESPPLYDPEELTDRSMRYLAAEAVREKIFLAMEQEVPYAAACEVEEYKERSGKPDYIRISIYVERESQKRMLIGKNGSVLKKLGAQARAEIEKLTGEKVYLDLWVKVHKNWRKNPSELRQLGYYVPKPK